MGIGRTSIEDISAQTCKLLMEIVEQRNPNISHSVLFSEFDDTANFLLKENYLINGRNLETYWLATEDKDVEVMWNEKMQSFTYLSRTGKFIPVKNKELETYDIDIAKIIDWFAKEFDVFQSSRNKQSEYLNGFLYFVGDAQIQKKKIAIFFARRINDSTIFNQIEEFFIKESPTSLPKLILTSSNHLCPESLKTKAKIISVSKLLNRTNNKVIFNMDYMANVLFSNSGNEAKPYAHCTEDGGVLFVGDKSWNIKGQSQRQVIQVMCDLYEKNPDSKMRWNNILSLANLDDSSSRYRDLFKNSAAKESIANANGFVWFKTSTDF